MGGIWWQQWNTWGRFKPSISTKMAIWTTWDRTKWTYCTCEIIFDWMVTGWHSFKVFKEIKINMAALQRSEESWKSSFQFPALSQILHLCIYGWKIIWGMLMWITLGQAWFDFRVNLVRVRVDDSSAQGSLLTASKKTCLLLLKWKCKTWTVLAPVSV